MSPERALVVTADFITPVVDDARAWGRVAAANAVSDIYAMGGTPILGLNLVCWNTEELSNDLLGDVLLGGQDIAHECGFLVAGGHTVDDPEPKYGMAVVGEVHPDRMLTNAGLVPGQALILTKPLMQVAHGGGRRLRKGDPSYKILHDWIGEGLRLDPDSEPDIVKIEVSPNKRVFQPTGDRQQLRVDAHFSDGTVRDVTQIAVYSSSNARSMANVSAPPVDVNVPCCWPTLSEPRRRW